MTDLDKFTLFSYEYDDFVSRFNYSRFEEKALKYELTNSNSLELLIYELADRYSVSIIE